MEHTEKVKPYLTVVMPAYNEELLIRKNLLYTAKEIARFAPEYRIIAVNDGSRDHTKEEITAACSENPNIRMISYDRNRGKGYAIKRGILAADSEYTAFLDSDLELPPSLLRTYLSEMHSQNADIVIGSKMHKDSKLEYPFIRKVMSYGYYILLRLLFHLNLKDTQTGIKLFRTDRIQRVMRNVRSEGFSFDIEMLAIASMYGYKIVEQPVVMQGTRKKMQGSHSKISFGQIFDMFFDTLKIKKRLRNLRKN